MNAIEVKNVCKGYGKVTALDDVTFSVGKGEMFVGSMDVVAVQADAHENCGYVQRVAEIADNGDRTAFTH